MKKALFVLFLPLCLSVTPAFAAMFTSVVHIPGLSPPDSWQPPSAMAGTIATYRATLTTVLLPRLLRRAIDLHEIAVDEGRRVIAFEVQSARAVGIGGQLVLRVWQRAHWLRGGSRVVRADLGIRVLVGAGSKQKCHRDHRVSHG